MYSKLSFNCYPLLQKWKFFRRERLAFDLIPESVCCERGCCMDGIKGIPRRNTDDFWILFIAPTITEKSVLSNIDLHKNETFLDVGANVGNYTLRVAHKYKDKEVRIISHRSTS